MICVQLIYPISEDRDTNLFVELPELPRCGEQISFENELYLVLWVRLCLCLPKGGRSAPAERIWYKVKLARHDA